MRRLLFVLLAALASAPAAYAWTWPADGRVLAPFSFDPSAPYAAGQHRGIDVAGSPGEPVRAPAAGTVSFAGTVPGSGKSITIETGDGWSVTLTHLGALLAKRDAAVAEGDVVGAVAGAASGEQPYVQLGLRRTADAQGYVDPLAFPPPRRSRARRRRHRHPRRRRRWIPHRRSRPRPHPRRLSRRHLRRSPSPRPRKRVRRPPPHLPTRPWPHRPTRLSPKSRRRCSHVPVATSCPFRPRGPRPRSQPQFLRRRRRLLHPHSTPHPPH